MQGAKELESLRMSLVATLLAFELSNLFRKHSTCCNTVLLECSQCPPEMIG